MKTLAYLRVSTDSQYLNAQKLAILSFAQREGIVIGNRSQSLSTPYIREPEHCWLSIGLRVDELVGRQSA